MPDKKAFEKFYNLHLDKVYRFVFFRTGNSKELAEDLVSEIFMKALEHFDSYDEAKSKSAWIMTIAKNHLANFWRDKKQTVPLPGQLGDEDEAAGDEMWLKSGLAAGLKEEGRIELAGILLKLEPNEREIVTFHYLFGYNYAEIGGIKGMSEGAVKVASHRAIKKLKKFL